MAGEEGVGVGCEINRQAFKYTIFPAMKTIFKGPRPFKQHKTFQSGVFIFESTFMYLMSQAFWEEYLGWLFLLEVRPHHRISSFIEAHTQTSQVGQSLPFQCSFFLSSVSILSVFGDKWSGYSQYCESGSGIRDLEQVFSVPRIPNPYF